MRCNTTMESPPFFYIVSVFFFKLCTKRNLGTLDLPADCRKLQKMSSTSVGSMMHALPGECSQCSPPFQAGSANAATFQAALFKLGCFIYRIAMPSLIPTAHRNCNSRVPAKQDLLFIKFNTPKSHLEKEEKRKCKPPPVHYHSYKVFIMASICNTSNAFTCIY